jgi:hypothetical protein
VTLSPATTDAGVQLTARASRGRVAADEPADEPTSPPTSPPLCAAAARAAAAAMGDAVIQTPLKP